MTAKIEFFYTHGHTYTATGVDEDTIVNDGEVIKYVQRISKESLDIYTTSCVVVQKHDLKFAIVTFSEDSCHSGCTDIIHGLVEKFDIMPTFAEAAKIRKQEVQESQDELRIKLHKQKEAAKYVARRKKRSSERKLGLKSESGK